MLAEIQPNPWMVTPFVALLATLALGPWLFAVWWGRHFAKVVISLGAITVLYYAAMLHAPGRVLHMASDYLSFISLIGALFIISGGIHITVKGEATPGVNVLFLLTGALLSNVLGTTGASMLLIRPWMRMNQHRLAAHHIVFFVFIVSNVGGSLTPIGDPPLFLGYLKGIPFWWLVERCWAIWITGTGILLGVFYILDRKNFRRAPQVTPKAETAHKVWQCQGWPNLAFLCLILGAMLINRPPFVREALMVAAAAGSYFTTKKEIHRSNQFQLRPIMEVAIVFAGIFCTMLPALDWLAGHASQLTRFSPGLFYWGSGTFSTALDNAPTYLAFMTAQQSAFMPPESAAAIAAALKGDTSGLTMIGGEPINLIHQAAAALQTYFPGPLAANSATPEQVQMAMALNDPVQIKCLKAISIGSVFFGAGTYIGNGPNFLVKAIADQYRAPSPGFLGYILRFTLPYLLPMLLIVWWFFFR